MPSTVVDSAIFGNLFSSEAMRSVFGDQNRTQMYLDVEAALARVQGRLGVIPATAADEIELHCRLDQIDMEKLRVQTERAGSPIVGLVQQLTALCANDAGQYCHWGATTQDITDTATVLQIRKALVLVDADLTAISAALAQLARKHRDTPMVGRSHLQQAAPITFGFKVASTLSAIERHRDRLDEIRSRALVGEFAGAVGTLASIATFDDRALATQSALMHELALAQPDIAWHAQRDGIAEVGCLLALVVGTLDKFATDIKLMMQTEVGELYEPFAQGRGSSSTMPQKRNPVSCVYIHACSTAVRQHAATLLDAMVTDHERATGPWHAEWIALPEAFLFASGALAHARFLAEGLEVDTTRMRENLDLTHGLVVSEAVMMGLAPHLGRQRAHDLIYDLCRRALTEKRPLLALLGETDEITSKVDAQTLAKLCDPANYLGLARAMVDRVLAARSKR